MGEKSGYKVSAAGRVNLIGEHVDYCGGKVFPVALSLKNTVYVRPNGTGRIRLRWTTLPDTVTLEISELEKYRSLRYGNYQAGAAFVWQRLGHRLVGCDMLHDCNVPFGGGLSSSAAIEVSTLAALATVAGESIDPIAVALAAQRAEREYVGTNCGIMDQYVAACGRKGKALLIDCNTLDCRYVPFDTGEYSLVIANTNKPHSLIEGKYNERRAETEEGLSLVRRVLDVGCLADLSVGDLDKCKAVLPEKIFVRVRHVVEECARVNEAAVAMERGDMRRLGELFNRSHASLRDLYEVTGKELDSLAFAAQSHPACIGSRMTGGGFGGCTVSLVRRDCVADFCRDVGERYRLEIGYSPTFFEAMTGDGITIENCPTFPDLFS